MGSRPEAPQMYLVAVRFGVQIYVEKLKNAQFNIFRQDSIAPGIRGMPDARGGGRRQRWAGLV